MQKRREKMGATKDWFRRRRGGEQEVRRKEDPVRSVQLRNSNSRTREQGGPSGWQGTGVESKSPREWSSPST